MPHPSAPAIVSWQASLYARKQQDASLQSLIDSLAGHVARLNVQFADGVQGSAESLALLDGGISVQRALLDIALTSGQPSPADEARRWTARHMTRFWVAAISEAILETQNVPALQRRALSATLGQLANSKPVLVSDLQDAQQQLAAGMAAHSKRVCIQTLQSAEPRDAQKLQLNLEGFIGRIPDHDGIVQQVRDELPQLGAGDASSCQAGFADPMTGQLMVDPVVTVDGRTHCRFALIATALSGAGRHVPPVCMDDIMARNALFQSEPQQQQAFRQQRAVLCREVDAAFSAGRFDEAWRKALYAEQMLLHAGERSKSAQIASKRAFMEKKRMVTSSLTAQIPKPSPSPSPSPPPLPATPKSRTKACCIIQ